MSGIIVETEAYRPDDPACHAYKNVGTMRNRTIFSPPGFAYVYLSYGIHCLINVVCEDEGVGSAVLIRALEPVEGEEIMIDRRGRDFDLCNGPGKLTQAFGITLEDDGRALTNGNLNIVWGEPPNGEIVSTTRIGISRGTELPWRYLVLDEPNVSVPPKHLAARGLQRSV
jgi:DNA-3-methyladenine glycosylase